jgi:hypothetical protein
MLVDPSIYSVNRRYVMYSLPQTYQHEKKTKEHNSLSFQKRHAVDHRREEKWFTVIFPEKKRKEGLDYAYSSHSENLFVFSDFRWCFFFPPKCTCPISSPGKS